MPESVRTTAIADDDDGDGTPRIAAFWTRLNDFFLFPFQMEPLIWAIGLTLFGSGAMLLMGFFIPLLGFVPLMALGIAFYFFKVAALASRGVLHSKDYTSNMMDPDWKTMPWALFGVMLVHGTAIWFLGNANELLGLLAQLISSLVLPATVMVLIRSARMVAALNPLELLATITDIGAQYLLLCLFLFLLQAGMPITMELLLPIVPKMLLLPAFFFVLIYFTWVMAALIGYVMYQHHHALQIDLLKHPSPQANVKNDTPAAAQARRQAQEARRRDTMLADMVQKGDMREALAQAREWVRITKTPLPDHRRYHRVLLLDDPASGRLATHTPEYIALLLAERQNAEALKALQEVQRKLPGFALDNAPATLALAQYTWTQLDAHTTLQLLRGFDKRFAQAQEIPKAYELIVRAIKQGLGDGGKALPIFQAMQRRFPGHPSTQEAQWLLRDDLQSRQG